MTGIKINVGADVSAAKQELNSLRDAAKSVRDAVGSGKLTVDTSEAAARLAALKKAAESARIAIDTANKQKVSIDTSEAEASLQDAADAAAEVADALQEVDSQKVGIDTSEAKKALKELADLLRADSGKGAISRSLQDAKELEQQLAKVKRTQDFLSRAAGRPVTQQEAKKFADAFARRQSHDAFMAGFADVEDWHANVGGRFSRASDADRHVRDRMRAMSRSAGVTLGGDEGGGPAGSGQGGAHPRLSRIAGAIGGAASGIVAGGDGGMFSSIGAGVGGLAGMIPGAGLVLGPLLGAALGGVGRQLDAAMSDAVDEAFTTSRLRSSMGDASDEFDTLRQKTRHAADGMAISYQESAKLAQQYAKITNSRELSAGGVRDTFAFSRGLGLDPSQGMGFFGEMRHVGVTSDDKTARKFGLTVAEAIGRGGVFAKSDEVLQAISAFAKQATMVQLATPNAEAYASMLATGTAQKIPGLDVQGAAAIIGHADSSMRGGGSFGEASKIVTMSALARANPSMDVFDVRTMMEGGLFGSAKSAFGEGSMAYKRAKLTGNKAEMERLSMLASGQGADRTNLSRVLEVLREGSPSDSLYLETVANNFGLSKDQAAALDLMQAKDPGLGRMSAKLQEIGIDPTSVGMGSMASIAEISSGDSRVLDAYHKRLKAGDGYRELSKDEAGMLEGAERSGDQDQLRDVLIKLMATRDRQETLGDRAMQSQMDLKNQFTRFAGSMIPLTTNIKDGVLALVEKFAPESDVLKKIKEEEAAAAKLAAQTSPAAQRDALASYKEAKDRLDGIEKALQTQPMTDYVRKHIEATRDHQRGVVGRARDRVEASGAVVPDDAAVPAPAKPGAAEQPMAGKAKDASLSTGSTLKEKLASAERDRGLPAGLLDSIIKQETGGKQAYLDDPAKYHYPVGPDGRRVAGHTGRVSTAFGPFGILESTGRDPGFGVSPLRDKSLDEQIRFAADYLSARIRNAGSVYAGLAGYGEGSRYATQVMSRLPSNDAVGVPESPDGGRRSAGAAKQNVKVDVQVTVVDKEGRQRPDVVTETKGVYYEPMPAGVY